MIAGYFRHYGGGQAILDVCCGEGILQQALGAGNYERYLGLDISDEAIRRAHMRQDAKTVFLREDATSFAPAGRFQVIVFNECLYYFDDPRGLMKHYQTFLGDEGVFVVSMYVEKQTRRIWKMLGSAYTVEDEVQVINGSGVSWVVKVLRPRNSPGAGAAGG